MSLDGYKQQFDDKSDGTKYLQTYNSGQNAATVKINSFHDKSTVELFKMLPKGGKLVEIGCGPYIANLLMASNVFDELYPADYSVGMRQPLEEWVQGQETRGYDQSLIIDAVAGLMGTSKNDLVTETRRKTKKVLFADIHDPKVLASEDRGLVPFDALVTRFCVDSCSPDLESYNAAIVNIANLVKMGGYFLQIGFYDNNLEKWSSGFWNLHGSEGEMKVKDIRLNKSEIMESYERAGLRVVAWRELNFDSQDAKDFECTSTYLALSQKVE